MNTLRSMTVLGLAAGALYAWTRAGRLALQSHRVVTARLPDRDGLERPGLHREGLDSYQDLLDESLSLTFPASDPICAQAATRCGDRVETSANPADWQLRPGSIQDPQGPARGLTDANRQCLIDKA